MHSLEIYKSEIEDKATEAQLRDASVDCLFVQSDVLKEAEVKALVETTVEKFGKLDCAFNNAGIHPPNRPLHEQSIEDFDKLMAINVRGVFLSMQYEIQQMLSQGGGAIVNTSSILGLVAFRGMHYSCR